MKALSFALMLALVLPLAARAQGTPAAVVTRLEGTVTATRASLPQPVALKFKDGVFVNDRIVTGDQSIVRMLLGGKALVTVRERSSLTITEVPGRSTVNLESGKIALAVARERMRVGDWIEIRTPNAVAGIRGTVVIADYKETTAPPGGLTTFFGLKGTFQAIFGTQSILVEAGQFATGGAAGATTGKMTAEMLAEALGGLQTPTVEGSPRRAGLGERPGPQHDGGDVRHSGGRGRGGATRADGGLLPRDAGGTGAGHGRSCPPGLARQGRC